MSSIRERGGNDSIRSFRLHYVIYPHTCEPPSFFNTISPGYPQVPPCIPQGYPQTPPPVSCQCSTVFSIRKIDRKMPPAFLSMRDGVFDALD